MGSYIIIEVAVQAKNVRVAEVALDFYLTPQLVLHVVLDQLGLEEEREGHDVLGTFLPGQVHVPELPLPQRTADLMIAMSGCFIIAGARRIPQSRQGSRRVPRWSCRRGAAWARRL